MLTGEYMVLHGAKALSLPLKLGQTMDVRVSEGISSLQWKTLEKGRTWFEAHYSLPEFAIGNTNDFQVAKNLRDILVAARKLNPGFLTEGRHYMVSTNLQFDFRWGLGSSSSLIANISSWADVDPFMLNTMVSEGSGYDIATSLSESPIIYSLSKEGPKTRKVPFDPVFKDKLYFVYTGEKRITDEAVKEFRQKDKDFSAEIADINAITESLLMTNNLIEFTGLLAQHEQIIGDILGETTIKKKRFFDFNGFVKSLGAWGGDFVLFASDYPVEYVTSYLKRKNLNTWFYYRDIVGPVNSVANV